MYVSNRKVRLEMNIQEVKKIVLVLFLFIVLSHVVESKACDDKPAPTPTPSPSETPLLILQLRCD